MYYFLRRIGSALLTLFFILTLTFILMKAIPGDPFSDEKALPPEVIQALHAHYGLDKPWYEQYGHYLLSMATWDFGPSLKYRGRTVNSMIGEGFPVSALLGMEALLLASTFGLILGTIAALKHNQWQDKIGMVFTVFAVSIPSFILATLLQFGLGIKLALFPIAQWGGMAHTVLPALSLAAYPTAVIARLCRVSLLEVLQLDYVRMAKAKGLSSWTITLKHVIPNGLIPVLGYMGPLIANILVGSFVIEKIFAIPGLGQWFVNSVSNRDYPVIIGITLFYSVILLCSTSVTDLLYGYLDPKIRKGRS
jgi:oligopeptide transport system permease protein